MTVYLRIRGQKLLTQPSLAESDQEQRELFCPACNTLPSASIFSERTVTQSTTMISGFSASSSSQKQPWCKRPCLPHLRGCMLDLSPSPARALKEGEGPNKSEREGGREGGRGRGGGEREREVYT